MPMRQLFEPHEINEFPPHVRVKRSTRARRMALRLDPKDRAFHLVIPKGISLKRAQRFAEEHDTWMKDKLRNLPKAIQLKHGDLIPIFGRNRRIEINYDRTLRGTTIELATYELKISTNMRNPKARIIRFLKELAREEMENLSRQKARRIRENLNTVRVRETKARWGSCSADRDINYCWRLIFAPYEAMDYVVAHEVAHLRHLDHSPAFWALCRKLSDNYLEGSYWMGNHGHELMSYGAER
jgi:predicted metal-dependent hydrolase